MSQNKEEVTIAEVYHYHMKSYVFKTLRDTEEILVFDTEKGVYVKGAETYIKEKTKELMADAYTLHKANEVISNIRASTYVDRDIFNKEIDKIVVENGILNIFTGELTDFTPGFLSTIRIPIFYDPDAKCPETERFISDIVEAAMIPVLWEIIGFPLYREYFIHKAVMLNGTGRNGKSVFLRLIKKLYGDENSAAVSLQKLSNARFSSASLYGKLLNIVGDLSAESLRNTESFKELTGEDYIDAEVKFKSSFTFLNYAKLFFSANKLPFSYDQSYAFFSRWIIVDFPYTFVDNPKIENEKKKDRGIFKKITEKEELPGILNLAIKGLKRLIANGCFSDERETEAIIDEYKCRSDSVYSFVKEKCEFDPISYMLTENLFEKYCIYCRENNELPIAINKFVNRLTTHFILKSETKKIDGRRRKTLVGIKYVEDVDNVEGFFVTKNISKSSIYIDNYDNTVCNNNIRGKPSTPSTLVSNNDIESSIYEHVLKVSKQDPRGALINALVEHITNKKSIDRDKVSTIIDEMIDNGNLLINERTELGECFVVRG